MIHLPPLRLALPLLLSLLAVAESQPLKPGRGPIKEIEIVFLLRSGVSSVRLQALVNRFGLGFEPSLDTLELIRAAGGDTALLAALRAAKPAAPPPASRSAPVGTSSPTASPAVAFEPETILVRKAPRGDFYLSKLEITNRQYVTFCQRSDRPRPETPFWGTLADFPAVNVTWHDAVAFCRWLLLETGRRYRLPTEAEWEYAARAGLVRRTYPWGDEDPVGRSCFGTGGPCSVGSFKPNGFGLHDMAGSVFEWCQDPFSTGGKARSIRGGSWASPIGDPGLLAIGRREKLDADKTRNDVGFRVARDP